MAATPELRRQWEGMRGFAKREVGGKLQVGRYQIRTDSIDWFDYPLSRPPTIASTEPAGVVAVPVSIEQDARAHTEVRRVLASAKPIKKRAKRKAKA